MLQPDAYISILEAPLDKYSTPDVGDEQSIGVTAPFAAKTRVLARAAKVPVLIIPYTRPISLGSYGADVRGAKRAIWRGTGLGVPKSPTKTFGPIAMKQLRLFQREQGLTADGVLGPSTLRKLAVFFDAYAFLLYAGYPPGGSREQKARAAMVAYALWGYNNRDAIHYAEFRPMTHMDALELIPATEDCSTFATKDYKYAGVTDPNGLGYDGYGNTTTMRSRGRVVSLADARPGDLVQYSNPDHVAIYVGFSRVISHGSEVGPSLSPLTYRPVREIRSYF